MRGLPDVLHKAGLHAPAQAPRADFAPSSQLITHCSPRRAWRARLGLGLCPAWDPRNEAAFSAASNSRRPDWAVLPSAATPTTSGPRSRRLPLSPPRATIFLLALSSSAPGHQAAAPLQDCQAGRLHEVTLRFWRAAPETRMRSDSAPNLHLPAAATSSRSPQPLRLAPLCRQRKLPASGEQL